MDHFETVRPLLRLSHPEDQLKIALSDIAQLCGEKSEHQEVPISSTLKGCKNSRNEGQN